MLAMAEGSPWRGLSVSGQFRIMWQKGDSCSREYAV